MDRFWKPGMSEEEAMGVLEKCINELQTRFLINSPVFRIKRVDKSGVEELEHKFKPSDAPGQ